MIKKLITCCVCYERKNRVKVKKGKGRAWKFQDELGNDWKSPIVCSTCVKPVVKTLNNDIKKEKLGVVEKTYAPPKYHPTKKCDTCKGKLNWDRYRTCHKCKQDLQPDLDVVYGAFRETDMTDYKISDMPLIGTNFFI